MASLLMIGVFFVLLVLNIPVCAAMGIAAMVGLTALGIPVETFVRYLLHDVMTVPLLAIPFFILAANIMNECRLTRRIFDFAEALVGFMRGGLAQVNVVSSFIFAGISGSALADIAGLGSMQMNAMRRAGYRPAFIAALTIASSTLAAIVPPSIIFILYAIQMNVSVGQMFAAGILPGLVIVVVLMAFNFLWVRTGIEKVPESRPFSWRAVALTGARGLPALLMPLVIMRSMATGLVTPTEASIIAIVYALFLAVIYREISPSRLLAAATLSARATTMIMYLTAVGSVMAFVLTSDRAADTVGLAMTAITDETWLLLVLVTLAILVMGCFLETVPALLIAVPLFGPMVVAAGVDPVHFGVVLSFTLLIGIITPPIGLGVFAVCAVTGLSLGRVMRASVMFYPAILAALGIIMAFPGLSTWLPGLWFPAR